MKHAILSFFLFLSFSFYVYGLKPDRTYRITPHDMELEYNEILVLTSDNYSINTWHIIPQNNIANKTIIISYGDSGNMSYWLSLAYGLIEHDFDVWMYDYRGFGASSDFEMNLDQLYYIEFVNDLTAVIELSKKTNPQNEICLLGLSMGTIVNTLYFDKNPSNINFYIGEGIIYSLVNTIDRLKNMSDREWVLPIQNSNLEAIYENLKIPVLIFSATNDVLCTKKDIKKIKKKIKNIKISVYKGGHLGGLMAFQEQYMQYIADFLNNKKRMRR